MTDYFRWDIINFLIQQRKYQSYLEVGTCGFTNYNQIKCDNKECIDPNPNNKYTYNMTSDEAFKIIKDKGNKYDIIFIDGLHWSEQVTRDINNSLSILNPNGVVVLHDCNPPTVWHACWPMPNPCQRPWNGDCFKSIISFKNKNPQYFTCVVDTDWGVGIIDTKLRLNVESPIIPDGLVPNYNDFVTGGCLVVNNKNLTWDYFDMHRAEILNLISPNLFKTLFT